MSSEAIIAEHTEQQGQRWMAPDGVYMRCRCGAAMHPVEHAAHVVSRLSEHGYSIVPARSTASANILRGECAVECKHTWHSDYGPNRSIPGTHASKGDVRRCGHGNIWIATGRIRESYYFTQHDEWDRVSRFWEPLLYRKATRALTAAEKDTNG